jgi:hypothetical protein
MDISSVIELHDSEIIELEKGPLAYLQKYQGRSVDLEGFRRAAIESFSDAGFSVNVKAWTTDQEGVYAFDLEINGRVPGGRRFDPDRQVHEVVSNILELPDQDGGWIKTDKKMLDDLASGNAKSPQWMKDKHNSEHQH